MQMLKNSSTTSNLDNYFILFGWSEWDKEILRILEQLMKIIAFILLKKNLLYNTQVQKYL